MELNQGKKLAETYCTSCHQFPKAKTFPKKYWEEVLPVMSFFLSAQKEGTQLSDFKNPIAKQRLLASGLFPKAPLVTKAEWKMIQEYYFLNASKENKPELTPNFIYKMPQFTKEVFPWKAKMEGLTYLNFYEGIYDIGYNTKTSNYHLKLDNKGNETVKTKIESPLVNVIKNGNIEFLLLLGRMANVDEPTGKIIIESKTGLSKFIESLERPIDFVIEDLDKDGVPEILVAEFGKYLGGINIYTKGEKGVVKKNIYAKPGAIKFVLKDINKDGLKDFYVLLAQENESVYLFLNKGNLEFEKQRIISLPPDYGTTYFEMLDFDKDGDLDIITSSGDSDDFVSVLKPNHGVRLHENLGNHKYKQVWFHKQEGSYGTVSADFDNDGDIDIASIGYYASAKNKKQESFLYFENIGKQKSGWSFKTYSLADDNLENSCFMLIKAKDVDNDGDLDIILGSNAGIFGEDKKTIISKNWQNNGGAITVLKNNYK
ncbi:hypothetical protein FHR24_002348 [Wenyingzhuangia heitensis]|uniref:Repeat domain-containing protein n=1 Tax=Wenyingzhuangia heitensis TaxID=1487859 RepID=A0ABX0UAN0_9FLAO|nr:VCBS repeat-containing protein [Wenyingzhuangia heitensis]NIJ45877.1 hypothetical protein [Wenyingzhuangia heitensis]